MVANIILNELKESLNTNDFSEELEHLDLAQSAIIRLAHCVYLATERTKEMKYDYDVLKNNPNFAGNVSEL